MAQQSRLEELGFQQRPVGGLEQDILTGGPGQDSFLYRHLAPGTDVIWDFKVGEDQINLQPLLATSLYSSASPQEKFARYVQLAQEAAGTWVLIDLDGSGAGTQMSSLALLRGVQASSLTASSFVV